MLAPKRGVGLPQVFAAVEREADELGARRADFGGEPALEMVVTVDMAIPSKRNRYERGRGHGHRTDGTRRLHRTPSIMPLYPTFVMAR